MWITAAELGPGSIRHAVRIELALAFTRPYVTPVVVAGNAALVLIAWAWLPVGVQDWLLHFTERSPSRWLPSAERKAQSHRPSNG